MHAAAHPFAFLFRQERQSSGLVGSDGGAADAGRRMSMRRDSVCQRGQTLALYICHCRECQKQSASAFGMSLEIRRAGFRLTQGEPRFWSRAANSGRRLRCAFCPNCGSRLWDESKSPSETITIKAGSLDPSVDVSTAIHIWVSRKLPGVIIPVGAKQFAEEPE
jgi:hypothetical protein